MENNNCDIKNDISNDTTLVTDNSKIVNNVKFNNEPLETSTISERKRKLQEKAKNKQLAEEKYNLEVQEQQYKRLMHLLTRSKFYASYIVNKIDNSLEKDINKTNKAIKKINSIDENKLPQEKEKKKKS